MARNEQDEKIRKQSYSPNARDFDREYNPQGSQGRQDAGRDRSGFESNFSGNADRWTGYEEGPQHWREGRNREGDVDRRREYYGRDERGEGQRGRSGYERDDWGREGGPGMTGRGDRGSFSADQGHDAAHGPGGWSDSGRGNWGGVSTYGSGVSGYSAVGPFSSAGFGGGYAGMGSYGAGYSGGMGTYAGRKNGPHAGRAPKGYQRSDERIREEINERLTDHPDIDPSEVEVQVQAGEVTLTGIVEDRNSKRLAEDIADGVSGVRDVNNQIRVKRRGQNKVEEETDKQQVTTLGINPGDRKLKNTDAK